MVIAHKMGLRWRQRRARPLGNAFFLSSLLPGSDGLVRKVRVLTPPSRAEPLPLWGPSLLAPLCSRGGGVRAPGAMPLVVTVLPAFGEPGGPCCWGLPAWHH